MQNTPRSRMLVISHQLPFLITLDETRKWRFAPRTGHAALYAGIEALHTMDSHQVIHVGWTGFVHDAKGNELDLTTLDDVLVQQLKMILNDRRCEPVFLPSRLAVGHYESYCKTGTL
jgi:trehalose-6-phosphate synthase